jgi:hypothetical protein
MNRRRELRPVEGFIIYLLLRQRMRLAPKRDGNGPMTLVSSTENRTPAPEIASESNVSLISGQGGYVTGATDADIARLTRLGERKPHRTA